MSPEYNALVFGSIGIVTLWQYTVSQKMHQLWNDIAHNHPKHANSILEYFEYFYQMSSKSVLTILIYTVSKLVRFFETQCS